jgi:hypothetical protein
MSYYVILKIYSVVIAVLLLCRLVVEQDCYNIHVLNVS